MSYSQRLLFAATFSLLAHIAIVAALRREPATPFVPDDASPIMVQLREEPLRYIDTAAPTETPPEDAAFIAVEDARAMDRVDAVEEEDAPDEGPTPETPDTIDVLPRPEQTPEPEPIPVSEPEPEPTPEPAQITAPTPTPASPAEDEEVPAPPEELPERMEIARADPAPLPPEERPLTAEPSEARPTPEPPRDLRARPRGRTVTHGMTNFEALRHEIAPYLKHIRDKVEKRWIEALLMRYTGTSPTRAEVFCAIAPDGTLVEVRVVGMADDAIFAAICREAIERAAPFDPFPFETPDIYRNKNLEINWHFNFL